MIICCVSLVYFLMILVEEQAEEENKKRWRHLDHCNRVSVHPPFTRFYFMGTQEHRFLRHQTSGHFATSIDKEHLSYLGVHPSSLSRLGTDFICLIMQFI